MMVLQILFFQRLKQYVILKLYYMNNNQVHFKCMLAESELNDILSVSLDYTGRVITVTLAVSSTSTCEGAVVPIESLKEFSTNVFVRHSQNGPMYVVT